MIKRLPRPVESEENKFNREFYQWLNDSHYWIEENDGKNVTCKWCGAVMPLMLNHSTLCKKNPEILKIIEETKRGIYDNNPDNGDDNSELFHILSTLNKDELIEMLKDIYLKFKK
jgi:hypothetical protein